MATFASRMKRKELEDVSDGFSEFSLSAPSRKIRRLDVDLVPIMGEEHVVPSVPQQQFLIEQMGGIAPQFDALVEDAPQVPVNEERAIVLYKPIDSPLYLSPSSSNVSFTVSSDMYPGLKNQVFWPRNSNPGVSSGLMDCKQVVANDSLAMVPWVPTPASATPLLQSVGSSNSLSIEPMEAEEVEGASMEVEEETEQTSSSGTGAEVFQQWHQQHCMTPEIPTTRTTQVMWSL
ncbi:hypothetical protein J5N97_026706 [Dioscorea zingiberensis]|uniref:Uncharacterized protein n=1 Tax=Dioscorea zingiberensis TaxID=325984 RepID=A0A9D5H6Y3_9LILI|nr:hypothetical protein J5N97_026706 [Dioscorea zingiberensis]